MSNNFFVIIFVESKVDGKSFFFFFRPRFDNSEGDDDFFENHFSLSQMQLAYD